jgi:hypothetical protein
MLRAAMISDRASIRLSLAGSSAIARARSVWAFFAALAAAKRSLKSGVLTTFLWSWAPFAVERKKRKSRAAFLPTAETSANLYVEIVQEK